MALDFPSSPTNGQTFTGPNGVLWAWDGVKWTNATQPGGTAYAPIDTPVFIGNPQAPNPPPGDSDTSIATTSFVTSAIAAAGGSVTIAATPPTVTNRALWWDSTGGQLYVGYDDGVGPIQWVAASNITGLANAATKADVGTALNNVGRNLIHNSAFTIAQRGSGPWAVNGYTLDRWWLHGASDTFSVSRSNFGDTGRTQVGDEAASWHLDNTFTGNAAAGASHAITQPIEDVRRLAGKTVMVSFWATCAAGTPKLGVSIDQAFGTGGSPSAQVNGVGQSVTLTSTTWARYSLIFIIPSASGKILGTANDHATNLNIWFSSGATNATLAGNIGVQSGTINIWGVQLEIAQPGQTQPTPLEKRDPVYELQQAMRFFQTGFAGCGGTSGAGQGLSVISQLPVPMRAIPNMAIAGSATVANCTSPNIGAFGGPGSYQAVATVTTGGAATSFYFNYTASADL